MKNSYLSWRLHGVVGTKKIRLTETVLLNTHNIGSH